MRGCICINSGGGMPSPSLLSAPRWRWPIVFSLSSSSSTSPQSPLHSLISPTSLSLPRSRKASLSFSPLFFSFSSSLQYASEKEQGLEEEEEEVEEHVIGDCLVFEDGIFEDPYLQQEEDEETEGLGAKLSPTKTQKTTKGKKGASKPTSEVEPQSLVPDAWKRAVEEINITKKERRQIARELEYGQRLDRKKRGYLPLRVSLEEYLKYRDEKLSTLQPVVLDNPPGLREEGPKRDEDGDASNEDETGSGGDEASRVEPRNPRWAVYGRGLEDISDFFNSGKYQPDSDKGEGGRQKLFTKEEKVLMNAKIPDLAVATSGKWLPLHTVAASGEFYLTTTLLKHIVDINASDKDGLTALHKAITCKKQAVTNLLLRESANPFVLDKDGATLMHYAVRTASINAIKTLLLYNVSINLQDNDGWSPLHLAVQTRRTDVVKLLLIKGADKTLRNRDGLTPLELCLYSGRGTRTYELIKLLKTLPRQRY